MINPRKEILMGSRVLFVKNGCLYCRIYYLFIEYLNMNLPLNKRIKIVNCTNYELYGVAEDNLINIFYEHMQGYPTLFIDGLKVSGSNTINELKAWLYAYLDKELLISIDNPYMFNHQCKFEKIGFKKRVICT